MSKRIEKLSVILAGLDEWLPRTRTLLSREHVGTLPTAELRLLRMQVEALADLRSIVAARLELANQLGAPDSLALQADDLYDWLEV